MQEIARKLGVDKSTVCRDIHAILHDWKQNTHLDVSAYVAIELEKINAREREAWAAWEASKKPKRIASAAKR